MPTEHGWPSGVFTVERDMKFECQFCLEMVFWNEYGLVWTYEETDAPMIRGDISGCWTLISGRRLFMEDDAPLTKEG